MKLEHMILALWVISSMLACWAFSLIVRWFTDRRARKVQKLQGTYTVKSRLLAAALVVICLLGSITAGGGAHLLSQQTWLGDMELSALGAFGIGMAMFAVFLTTWAYVGDRSRGRQRCPRCWYDMHGSNGLPCPECGQEIANEQQLLKTRRPKWAFVIAVVFVISGATCIGLNSRFRDHGLLGFVPNGVLISMRDHVPEDWIFDNGFSHSTLRLADRIRSGSVSQATRRELATEVVDEMLSDVTLRWEPRRMEILNAAHYVELYGWGDDVLPPEGLPWMPGGDRIDRLYAACLLDYASMYQEGASLDVFLKEAMLGSFQSVDRNPWGISRRWILTRTYGVPETYYSHFRYYDTELVDLLSGIAIEARDMLAQVDSLAVYRGEDYQWLDLLRTLEAELGVMGSHVPAMIEFYEQSPQDHPKYWFNMLDTAIVSMPMSDRGDAHQKIESWILGTDVGMRADGINLLHRLYDETYVFKRKTNPPEVAHFIELLIEHTLLDMRVPPDQTQGRSISDLTWSTIINIDMTGAYSFPMVRDVLLNPSDSVFQSSYTNLQMYDSSTVRLENWIDAFGPLTEHDDPEVRWSAVSLMPTTLDPATDMTFDSMLERLVQDDDQEVMAEAYAKMAQRQRR